MLQARPGQTSRLVATFNVQHYVQSFTNLQSTIIYCNVYIKLNLYKFTTNLIKLSIHIIKMYYNLIYYYNKVIFAEHTTGKKRIM